MYAANEPVATTCAPEENREELPDPRTGDTTGTSSTRLRGKSWDLVLPRAWFPHRAPAEKRKLERGS